MELSRRNFLKGGAVLGLGAAATAMTACGATPGGKTDPTPEIDPIYGIQPIGEPTETISADICVVGGGGTGLGAAVQAAESGLKVVLVDLGATYGGSFVNTEGMGGVQTSFTHKQAKDPTVQDVLSAAMDFHHWIPQYGMTKHFFEETGETIDWCMDHNAKFSISAMTPTSAWSVHIYDHSEDAKGDLPGATFMRHLGEAADKAGVTSIFKTAGRKIIMKDGKVAGLLAEKEGKTVIQIDAPVVVLATGGYSTNDTMIRDMCDILHNEQLFSLGAEKRDGDGFKMALDAGGAFAPGKGTLAWCGPAIYGSGWCTHGYAAAVQPTLWVNQDAKRFFPEDQWLASFAAAGTAMAKEEKTFVIMSENDVKYFEETGAYVNVFTWMRTGNPMTQLREQFEANPNIYKCDTIEEVAEKLGLDAAALKATLTKYNAACEAGVDDEFGKNPVHMRKLEAPFWCAQAADGFYCTVGGLYVSDQFECMTKDNKIIPGLYAGGCDAGGLFGDSYDVLVCPGTCASFAVNSGRIIAKAAKKFLGK